MPRLLPLAASLLLLACSGGEADNSSDAAGNAQAGPPAPAPTGPPPLTPRLQPTPRPGGTPGYLDLSPSGRPAVDTPGLPSGATGGADDPRLPSGVVRPKPGQPVP